MKTLIALLMTGVLLASSLKAQPLPNQTVGNYIAATVGVSPSLFNTYLQSANPFFYTSRVHGTTTLLVYGLVLDSTSATDTMTIMTAKSGAGYFYVFGKDNLDTSHAVKIKLVAGDSLLLSGAGAYSSGVVSVYTGGSGTAFFKMVSDGYNWRQYFKLPESYFERLCKFVQ